jgi:hypothetical protein
MLNIVPTVPTPQVTTTQIVMPIFPTTPKFPLVPTTTTTTLFPTAASPAVVLPKVPASPIVPTTLNAQNLFPQGNTVVMPTINMIPIPQPVPMKVEVKELELRPWQIDWAHKAHGILLRNHGYIDTSKMRSGKTYVTLWIAKQFNFRILVVCPVTASDVWRSTAAEYGVECLDVISYQSLRSQKGHQPKHGFLHRFDNQTDGGVHQVSFVPTNEYAQLADQGIMVIFDEIHNIKNNSDQYKACNALIQPIVTGGGRSRFALLSGTPFDKEEHAVNLLKLIGYIRSSRLYHINLETRELVLDGMQELIDACNFIDSNATERVLADIPMVKSKMKHLCYVLYTDVIKASISGAMPSPTDITGTYDVKNGFYAISANKVGDLNAAITDLAAAVNYNERNGTAEIKADNIGDVTKALVRIENAKVFDFARVATSELSNNPKSKVVICFNYTSSITEIIPFLIMYNPLILNGSIPAKKRTPIINAFVNDPARRVLIMNTAVGGVGISLYSTKPESPVTMLMSPSYKMLEITQAAARIYGPGMASAATVRMFYGRGAGNSETGILSAMARKSQVLKGTLDETVAGDLVLPGDYETVMEA